MSEFILSDQFISECFSDMWTLYLTFTGILLSVFTLLYSFVANKKDELKLITEHVKLGEKDPLLLQKQAFAIKYIKRLSKINIRCLVLLLISILLTFASWIGLRILNNSISRVILLIMLITVTLLVAIYIVLMFIAVIRQYRDDIKIM